MFICSLGLASQSTFAFAQDEDDDSEVVDSESYFGDDDEDVDDEPEEEPEEDPEPEEKPEPEKKPEPPPKKKEKPKIKVRPKEASTSKKSSVRVPNRRQNSGAGLSIGLGGSAVLRSMKLKGSFSTISHDPGVYIGGVIDLEFVLASIKPFGHLVLKGGGGYGTAQGNDDLQRRRPLVTENAWGYGALMFERPVSPSIDLRFWLGFGAQSFRVEPNIQYTGHRYMSALIRADFSYWFDSDMNLVVGLAAHPTVFTNQSDDADGDGNGFGATAHLDFAYRVLQPIENDLSAALDLRLEYTGGRYQSSFPLSGRIGSNVSSVDVFHQLMLGIRYHL